MIRGGLSQEDFSIKVGVHKNTVGRWEREHRTPDIIDLNKILEVFPDISPAWLLTGEGPMYRSQGGDIFDPACGTGGLILDMQVLEDAIDTAEEIISITGKKLKPAQKARGIRLIYEYFMEGEDRSIRDTSKVIRIFKDIV